MAIEEEEEEAVFEIVTWLPYACVRSQIWRKKFVSYFSFRIDAASKQTKKQRKKNLIKIMQIYDPHMHDNIKAFFLIFIFNNSSSKKNRQKQSSISKRIRVHIVVMRNFSQKNCFVEKFPSNFDMNEREL